MYLEWNESYSVGMKACDDEHKILFSLINSLHAGIEEKRDRQALEEVLAGLVAYVKVHFNSEETIMLKYGYPGYRKHKDEHDLFAFKTGYFHYLIQEGKAVLSVEVLRFMVEWLEKHLNGTDKLCTPFLAEKGVT